MKGPISTPVNSIQREFNALCEAGGGRGGGPAKGKVVDLLKHAGTRLNSYAYQEIGGQMTALADRNPWHVCFGIALSWGHMAHVDVDFSDAVSRLMVDWNAEDLRTAKSFYMYRGPEVIEKSLTGGFMMFQNVRLPSELPTTISKLKTSQDRWLGCVLGPNRPPYIGAWNATAMFMIALFAQPKLAATMLESNVLLPPSGAVFSALSYLHKTQFLLSPPDGSPLDDEAFEPGALTVNNGLFMKVRTEDPGWSMIDVHSGLYMLGTKLTDSETWFQGG